MKILIPVLHYYPVIGGLETWTQNIAQGCSKTNEVFVVTGRVLGQPEFEEKEGLKIYRTSFFSLKNLSFSSPLYILTALPFIFLKSLAIIKKEKINLCHCQGFASSFLGLILFKTTKTPYIVTVQGLENKGFLRKLAYTRAKLCIAASLAIKTYFEEIGAKRIEVIPNGIHLDMFKELDRKNIREKLGFKDNFIVMTVARLEKVKGIKCLVKAANILNKKYKMPNIKYIIIGDGSERKNLEDLVRELGLDGKVIFYGQISNDRIPEYLAAADCFVLPSLKEGFGIVILEAMASSLPVVASAVGGILDIIEDRKNGILTEPRAPEEIAEAVYTIYSYPEIADDFVKKAKEDLEKYNWENIVKKVDNIYLQFNL
jgi:glycosyltransferase involved in cell wall biosynthesis